jgi:uncharacterized membrane protein
VRSRDQRGQTSLLIIGFFLVTLLVVGVTVDASAAYLRRQSLDNLADSAALAAADRLEADRAYTGDLGGPLTVDTAAARGYVLGYLDSVGARGDFRDLTVDVRASGDAVVVHLEATVDLPIAPPDWEDSPRISGDAAATVVVG